MRWWGFIIFFICSSSIDFLSGTIIFCFPLFFLTKKVAQKSQGKRECSAALPGLRTTSSMHFLLMAYIFKVFFSGLFHWLHLYLLNIWADNIRYYPALYSACNLLGRLSLNQTQNKALRFFSHLFFQTFALTQRLIAC